MKKRTFILSLFATSLLNFVPGISQGRTKTNLKIYPVKYSKREKSDECLNYNGSCLLPLSKKPAVSFENTNFQVADGTLKFFIDDKTSKSLEKVTTKYDKLALVLDGKVLHTANVKEIIQGNSFKMTFRHPQNFEHLLEQLTI